MEEPSRLSSGGSSMLKAADADQAYAETNRKPICILTTNSWNPLFSLNGPPVLCSKNLSKSIIKIGRRLECGEGRARENLELDSPQFVLEIWQKS
jgi:hypothetical protein